MRKPPAIRQMRSTCSGVATPSCTSRSASRPNGRLQRLTMKPGASAASITRLPIASPASRAIASASAVDSAPATTSTSRILAGGLKKCMPTTRPGFGRPAASAVTLSDEVLVASTQSGSTTAASSPNSARLSPRSSGAASITSPHCASAFSSPTGSTPSGARASASGSGS